MIPQRRSGDTTGATVIRWLAGIASALAVAAISATAAMLFTLTHRADVLEYVLRFHGLWIGP